MRRIRVDLIKLNIECIARIKGNHVMKNVHSMFGKQAVFKDALHDHIFDNISGSYLDQFANSFEFEILGVTFTTQGIWLENKKNFIEWNDLGTKNYSTYYALFSKSNPIFHKTFEYLTDWNTRILYSVSRQILKDKGLYSEQGK
jgi:hypothetical protein